ncbi:UNKNOWN [Stylonychia lemnae]|uniref:Uncharacterized protein n=1 Tax=Stylonychia lemnae TaxID=5949 RepID=A0A078A3R3_STYLE|nr:UNKNOWN [Stylonychia lemnae]|eukprot:CDW76812.1 UNKNOWN [Stylonychia lemnae]
MTVISIPASYVISDYDYYPLKETIMTTLLEIDLVKDDFIIGRVLSLLVAIHLILVTGLRNESIVIIPLIDIPNHRQPKFLNQSDYVSFDLQVTEGLTTDENKVELIANTEYKQLEEFNYAYNRYIQNTNLLKNYGFVIDNNPFSNCLIYVANYFEYFDKDQLKISQLIDFIDSSLYDNKDQLSQQLRQKNRVPMELKYKIYQYQNISDELMNYLRIYALTDKNEYQISEHVNLNCENCLKNDYSWDKKLNVFELLRNLDLYNIFSYENELKSLISYYALVSYQLGQKSSIREDIQMIEEIKSDKGYFNDDTSRRQILSLVTAISSKQTLQVHLRNAMKKAMAISVLSFMQDFQIAQGLRFQEIKDFSYKQLL